MDSRHGRNVHWVLLLHFRLVFDTYVTEEPSLFTQVLAVLTREFEILHTVATIYSPLGNYSKYWYEKNLGRTRIS